MLQRLHAEKLVQRPCLSFNGGFGGQVKTSTVDLLKASNYIIVSKSFTLYASNKPFLLPMFLNV